MACSVNRYDDRSALQMEKIKKHQMAHSNTAAREATPHVAPAPPPAPVPTEPGTVLALSYTHKVVLYSFTVVLGQIPHLPSL